MFVTSAEAAAPTTHEGTEAHPGAEGSGVFPPFDSTTFASQLIWLAISFGLLYILMSRVALPRIAGIKQTRANKIATDLDAAKALQEQSRDAVAAYEAELARARSSAHDLAAEATATVNAEVESRHKELEAALSTKLSEAEAQIAATKAAAMSNVSTIATDAAYSIIEKLVGRAPDPAHLDAAVSEALRN